MSNYTNWTKSAIYCYKRLGNCEGCYYEGRFESDNCQMKHAVKFLLGTIGDPPTNVKHPLYLSNERQNYGSAKKPWYPSPEAKARIEARKPEQIAKRKEKWQEQKRQRASNG